MPFLNTKTWKYGVRYEFKTFLNDLWNIDHSGEKSSRKEHSDVSLVKAIGIRVALNKYYTRMTELTVYKDTR